MYLKLEIYVYNYGIYYLVFLMVSVYMYMYLKFFYIEKFKIWFFFLVKICKRFCIMICVEVNVRVGEILDVVMWFCKKILYIMKKCIVYL